MTIGGTGRATARAAPPPMTRAPQFGSGEPIPGMAGGGSSTVSVPAADGGPLVLPAGARKQIDGENFPVAMRVLPARLRRGLLALYAYARYVDDIGDEFDGPRVEALHRIADQVRLLYAGGRPDLPVVAGLSVLRDAHGVPAQPFLDLIRANIVDQQVSRYPTFADLVAYCRLSADPVGRVVLHLVGRPAEHLITLSDRICTGLQIIEHLQDVGEDYRAGRIYLPQHDLRRYGVAEPALGEPRASAPLRALLRYQTDRAVAYLNAGAPLVSALHGWGRLAVAGFLAGGRAAAGAIRAADYDVLGHDCSPSKRGIAAAYLRATVRTPG
jgi:squalene synthase HpnC